MNKGRENFIYDADNDLNELFNLEGVNSIIADYQKGFILLTVLRYIPIITYTIILSINLLISLNYSNKSIEVILILIGGIFFKDYMHKRLLPYEEMQSESIAEANREIQNILYRNKDSFNLDHLIFILRERINEKKDGNQTVVKIMDFFFLIIGVSTFLNKEFTKLIVQEYSQLGIGGAINVIALAFFIAWLVMEANSNFIRNPTSLYHKWQLLYDNVNWLKFKIKDEKIKNNIREQQALSR